MSCVKELLLKGGSSADEASLLLIKSGENRLDDLRHRYFPGLHVANESPGNSQ